MIPPLASAMYPDGFNPRVLKFCAWTGLVFCLMWLTGAGPVTGWVYLPPPSAADAAVKTVTDYTNHLLWVRIGCTMMIFSSIFYTTWGITVSMLAKKIEGNYPILFIFRLLALPLVWLS